MKTRKYVGWILSVAVLASTLVAQAETYVDQEGDTVWYRDIAEDVDYGTYGAVTVSGDTLNFRPLGLKAESSGGGAPTVNDAQLQFDVEAKEGKYVAGIEFSELGDLSLFGTGTDSTYVQIIANFFVRIDEVDGVSIDSITKEFSLSVLPNTDGKFELVEDGEGIHDWEGSVYLDLESMLDDITYIDGVTRAFVNLDNWLIASSEEDTFSSIQKKIAGGFSITSDVVPEPASVGLLGFTTLGLLYRRRTKGRSILGRSAFLRDPVEQDTVRDTGYVNTIKRLLSSKEQARAQWLNF